MCSYEILSGYKKKYLTFIQMGKIQKRCDEQDTDKEDDDLLSPLESKFYGKNIHSRGHIQVLIFHILLY